MAEPKTTFTPEEVAQIQQAAETGRAAAAAGISVPDWGAIYDPPPSRTTTGSVIVGAIPATGQVIVKDVKTGSLYYKPGTPEQVRLASTVSGAGMPYTAPEGVSPEKPSAGTPTPEYVQKLAEYNVALEQAKTGTSADGKITVSQADYDRLVKMADSLQQVEVYDYKGETVAITPEQAGKLATLTGKDQFDFLESVGLVPKGSRFVPSEEEKAIGWGYLPPWIIRAQEEAKQQLAEFERGHVKLKDETYLSVADWNKLTPEQRSGALESGWAGIESQIVRLPDGTAMLAGDWNRLTHEQRSRALESGWKGIESTIVRLPDGTALLADDWNALDPKYRTMALHEGGAVMLATLRNDAVMYGVALTAMEDYKNPEGGYDIMSAVGHGVTEDTLLRLFKPEDIKFALDAKAQSERSGVELVGEDVWTNRVTGEQYTKEEYQQLVKDFEQSKKDYTKGSISYEEWQAIGGQGHPANYVTLTPRLVVSIPTAMPGVTTYTNRITGESYTQGEYNDILKNYEEKQEAYLKGELPTDEWLAISAQGNPENYITLSAKDVARGNVMLASMMFPPARAALPEVTVADITSLEWALGGVNVALLVTAFAPGAVLSSLAGKAAITGISTAGAGLIGYGTAITWNSLSPLQKTLGVGGTLLYALPLLGTVARNIKITSVKIPTVEGQVTSWKGLSVAQNPVIGVSGGRLVLGARNITVPEANLILSGYKPEMMLDTKVFVNSTALKAAGFSDAQVDYLILSLKDRNLFAGKASPFLSKEALIEPTARLNIDEINTLLKQINKYNREVTQVDLIYGSASTKAQLAPELRGWRDVHDWDIQTSMTPEGTAKFTQDTLAELNKLPDAGKYKIDPNSPNHILKQIDGEWKGMVDIHSHQVSSVPASEIPASKLDSTGSYSYGRMVSEPAVTVEYPGVGKFDIMSLSEAGVRKSDTILRVRQTEAGTAFTPPERGIAHLAREIGAPEPGIGSLGVPKDAADFYVILRTFKGEKIANEWAESWARAMGYTPEELSTALPEIVRAMENVAQNTPSNLIGWRFRPSVGVEAGLPTITVRIPASLAASVSGSLGQVITSPISPYAGIGAVEVTSAQISQALSSAVLPKTSSIAVSEVLPYGAVSPEVSFLGVSQVSEVSVPSISGQVVSGVLPEVSLTPYPVVPLPSIPSPIPYPSPYPSPYPYTPPPSPSPPYPSPYPSPPPVSPPVIPEEPTTPPPPPFADDEEKKKRTRKVPIASIVWKHGWGWKVLPPPYDVQRIITLPKGVIPEGATKFATGKGSAKATLQVIGGKVAPANVDADLGIFDIHIRTKGTESWMWFESGGEKTVVGQSMASPTRGVTVKGKPTGPEYEVRGAQRYEEKPVSLTDEVSRASFIPSISRKRLIRKRKPSDGYSDLDRYYLGHQLPDAELKGAVKE